MKKDFVSRSVYESRQLKITSKIEITLCILDYEWVALSFISFLINGAIMKKLEIILRRCYRWLYSRLKLGKTGVILFRSFFNKTGSIFIHIPKAAGTSVSHALYGVDPGHHKLSKYEDRNIKKYTRYFKFTIVREPLSRLASTFYYLKKRDAINHDTSHPFNFLAKYDSLEDFILYGLNDEIVKGNYFFWSQTHYLQNLNGDIDVDYYGKMENLDADFLHICQKLNVNATLGKKNINSKSSGNEELSELAKEKVYKLYMLDYVNFKYKRPSC